MNDRTLKFILNGLKYTAMILALLAFFAFTVWIHPAGFLVAIALYAGFTISYMVNG